MLQLALMFQFNFIHHLFHQIYPLEQLAQSSAHSLTAQISQISEPVPVSSQSSITLLILRSLPNSYSRTTRLSADKVSWMQILPT